jgi:hypothetical protein
VQTWPRGIVHTTSQIAWSAGFSSGADDLRDRAPAVLEGRNNAMNFLFATATVGHTTYSPSETEDDIEAFH